MNENKTIDNKTLDKWVEDLSGPVALILTQELTPVDGSGGIIFPPTYANIGYSIDELSDGTKVAQIDSVGSQANRTEPIFKQKFGDNGKEKYLVPQIEFLLNKDEGEDRRVSLLDLAHRAGDAVVRSSELVVDIHSAFRELQFKQDAIPLAKVAPTSLIFGAWDSRGTQVKRPRIVRSFIRAEDVEVLHTAAQFNSVWKLLSEKDKDALEKEAKAKNADLAVKGFKDVPATFRKADNNIPHFKDGRPNDEARVLGGVIAKGQIYRRTTINLIALRSINGIDEESTKSLRRYLLGLALVAATAENELYLREGCLLRYANQEEEPWEIVPRRGKNKHAEIHSTSALRYAIVAADTFEVEQEVKEYKFDIKKAKEILANTDEADK